MENTSVSDQEDNPVHHYLTTVVTSLRHFGATIPKGHAYLCVPDYVLQRGQVWPTSPTITEVELGALRQLRVWPQQCYANCQQLVTQLPQELGLQYVEGMAICGHRDGNSLPLPLAHAWLLVDGKLYDPTWSLHGDYDVASSHYFGVQFSSDEVHAHIAATEEYSAMIDDWTHGYPLLRSSE